MRRYWLWMLAATSGCSLPPRITLGPPECPTPPGEAPQTPSIIPATVAGSFRLVQVWTSYVTNGRPFVQHFRLDLRIPDSVSAQPTPASPFNRPRSNLQLIGDRSAVGDTVSHREPVEVDAGRLYMGCRDCADASPDVGRITLVGPSGFQGVWGNAQTGIGRAIDDRGRELPNPQGYFCAIRDSSSNFQPGA